MQQSSPITHQPPIQTQPANIYNSSSAILISSHLIEDRIKKGIIDQSNQSVTRNWQQKKSHYYIPKTELGAKLWNIKKRILTSGQTKNDWDQVFKIINETKDINQ